MCRLAGLTAAGLTAASLAILARRRQHQPHRDRILTSHSNARWADALALTRHDRWRWVAVERHPAANAFFCACVARGADKAPLRACAACLGVLDPLLTSEWADPLTIEAASAWHLGVRHFLGCHTIMSHAVATTLDLPGAAKVLAACERDGEREPQSQRAAHSFTVAAGPRGARASGSRPTKTTGEPQPAVNSACFTARCVTCRTPRLTCDTRTARRTILTSSMCGTL